MIKNFILSAIVLFFSVSSVYAQNIVYRNTTDGFLYLKSASDTSNGTAITSVNSDQPSYSPDGQWIVYRNNTDGFMYKKSASDTSNGTAITSVNSYSPSYSPDGQWIIYSNASDGNKMYKKSASDTSNGSAITSIGVSSPKYSPDGQWIIFTPTGFFPSIYKMDVATLNYTVINNSVVSMNPSYSPDGQWIIYRNASDGNKMYKKSASDTSNGSAITSVQVHTPSYSPDGQWIVYAGISPNTFLYLKSASDTSNGSAINGNTSSYPMYEPIPPVINGSCGTNVGTYSTGSTAFTGSFCSAGTSSPTTPSFPALGSYTTWDCVGSGGGTTASCFANREADPVINGSCGTAVGTYGYTATNFIGTYCSYSSIIQSPTFPPSGSGTSWTCYGLGGGTNATCSVTVQSAPNSCASPVPTGGNYGALTYSPTSTNQAWVYGANSCGYACINGYTGSGCTTAPVSATGTGSEVGFWGSLVNPMSNFFSDLMGYLNKVFTLDTLPAPYGVSFSGGLNPIRINSISTQVACGTTSTTSVQNVQPCYYLNCIIGPHHYAYNDDRGSFLQGNNWIYTWDRFNIANNPNYSQTYMYTSGSVDITRPIVNGNFTYLKDRFGNDITTANIIQVSPDFSFSINWKYDVKVFGYGLLDVINFAVYLLIELSKILLSVGTTALSSVLDIVGMFFVSYPTSGDVCYFGSIMHITSTLTESGITHTQNTGLLDLVLLVLLAILTWKLFFKK